IDVGKKPDGKRKRSRQVTDDFNRNHQEKQPRNRSYKMLQVFQGSLLLNAQIVVIDEHDQGTSCRDIDSAGGGHESRNETHQVHEEDEGANSRHHRQILLAAVADDLLQLSVEKFDADLEQLLDFAGSFHGKGAAHEGEENTAKDKNDQGKNDVLGDDFLRRHIVFAKQTVDR